MKNPIILHLESETEENLIFEFFNFENQYNGYVDNYFSFWHKEPINNCIFIDELSIILENSVKNLCGSYPLKYEEKIHIANETYTIFFYYSGNGINEYAYSFEPATIGRLKISKKEDKIEFIEEISNDYMIMKDDILISVKKQLRCTPDYRVLKVYNKSKINEITNEELKKENLPNKYLTWSDIQRFALSFNGYNYAGSVKKKTSDIYETVLKKYKEKNDSIGVFSISDLRTALFMLQRITNNGDGSPGVERMNFVRAVLNEIEKRLK